MRIPPGAAFAALTLALTGCASVQAPPGGPEDRAAPELLTTRPAADAVVAGWRTPAIFVFDERLSERGIDQAVSVSPRTSPVVVRHSGDELRVSLREGWRPGVVYHIDVLPGLQDLFGNVIDTPVRLVFSTGPQIPRTRLAGTAIDRATREPRRDLRVEAIRTVDSLVYATATDTAGRFVIASIPDGDYLVRAFEDMNANRALDGFEPRDSASATISEADSAAVVLSVVLPDSTAPRLASARVEGRIVTLTFDDFLDPAQNLPPDDVEIRDAVGAALPVARVAVGALPPVDTAAAAPDDTLAVPPDTAAVPPPTGGRAPAAAAGAEPLPSRDLQVELEETVVLVPGAEYAVTVRRVRNIVGLAADAAGSFTAPAEPADSAASAPPGRLDR